MENQKNTTDTKDSQANSGQNNQADAGRDRQAGSAQSSQANVGSDKQTGSGQGTSAKMAVQKDTGSQHSASMKGEAGSESDTVLDKAKDAAGSLIDQAKASAGDAYAAVADKTSTMIDDKKSAFTGSLAGVADTVRRISSTINEGDASNGVTDFASQYISSAGAKLEGVADYFEKTDYKGMARDAESYARRNPAIFLGGAFVLGILAARLIKSTPAPSPLKAGAATNGTPVAA